VAQLLGIHISYIDILSLIYCSFIAFMMGNIHPFAMLVLPEQLHTDLVLIIQGVRRCGKSTLLMQLPKRYNLNIKDCYYCNFEDPRLLGSLDHTLLSQIVTLARQEVPSERVCYV
jgi:predicted AAA+ superfamily ATPase